MIYVFLFSQDTMISNVELSAEFEECNLTLESGQHTQTKVKYKLH